MTGTRRWVCDVVIDARSGGGSVPWTYAVGGLNLARGDAVFVPLGNRLILGYVVKVYEATDEELPFSSSHLRSVVNRIEGLEMPELVLRLVEYLAEDTLCPLSAAIGPAVPPGLKDRISACWTVLGETEPDGLNAAQSEAWRSLKSVGQLWDRPSKRIQPSTRRLLALLAAKGHAVENLAVDPFGADRDRLELLRLTPDRNRLETFLTREAKRRPAQALVVMRLMGADAGALTAAEIRALSGVTQATIRSLITSGVLEAISAEQAPVERLPEPNSAQKRAIDALVADMHGGAAGAFLLYGVTGSGKTEVYLRAAADALRMGRQVLYLVPEIALAAQAITRLRARFGDRITVLHSELTPLERLRSWARVKNGESPIVLGARSALFAPLTNLGLIIIDEEHEASFKQESAPRYHAKRAALHLAASHQATLVLGSATPSVETFFEAAEGKFTRLDLPDRAAGAILPEVFIADLTEGYRTAHPGILSKLLEQEMSATLGRGEQAILFLNRRAYAPFVVCRECGYSFQCPRCAVTLSYSRRDKELRCHHCGHRSLLPEKCPQCVGTRLSPTGVGTEKVEEALRIAFPFAKTARLDRDVAQRRGALETVLAGFRSGAIDILVGTQMVAKGLDFPRVTLVGAILADTSLHLPDFRAGERTFQLLAQVSGRAGRGASPGKVVIQTFNPNHIAIQAARTHDYMRAYETFLEERRAANYPPFCRLVNILVSSKQRPKLVERTNEIAERLGNLKDIEILGPADCAIERLNDHWRRHLVVKLPRGASASPIRDALADLQGEPMPMIDVDPATML